MTRASGETFLQDTVILGLMSANSIGQFEIHMDDVYIDNTRARAEIGDASAWNNCGHKEVQIPSSWSSSSVTVTVNQGSFSDGQAAYLYVVDSDGNPDPTGYPITVGDVTFTLTVTNGSGSGEYDEAEVVPISADSPASGKLFSRWIGDTSCLADRYAADTTVTMPSTDVSVTAVYAWGYQLTVNSGTGSGLYLYSAEVEIQADPAPSNMQFLQWTGDVSQVADVEAEATAFTILSHNCEVTATYQSALPGDLDGDGFVGQGDLDIILDEWGNSPPADPRADPSGDSMVGQADLDIVLDHWGEGAA